MAAVALAAALSGAPTALRAQEATASYGPLDAAARLLVRGTTDIAAFAPVIRAFLRDRPGLAIDYQQWGSNPLFDLSQAECAQGADAGADTGDDTGRGDLVISSGVHQMVKLVNDACAATHVSARTARLKPELRWRDQLWGITSEPAVIVYNRELVPPDEVPVSRFALLDLLRPDRSRYAGRVATYDIEESGLGYLFAFMDAQEATTFGGLLESLGRSGAVVTCCSAEIIDGVARGDYLVAYNVLGSYALARAREDRRIGVIAPNDYTLLLSRAAMIPRDAPHIAEARAFVDFILSPEGRTAMRSALLLVTVGAEGELVETEGISTRLTRPIELSPTLLVALDRQKRASFIGRWRQTFPRPGATPPAR
ncbi:ABC transporter substrate-binding protein [Brevirhabdus sp.]|uniref:ABC transporter substrate-binding protein n=1 Tax=Brevirhabdus sp. TaxID=2004514 RepID=UPI0040584F32